MPICLCACVCVCSGMHACLHMCLHAWVHALTCVWTVAQGQISIQSADCLLLCQFHLGNWLTTLHSVPVTTAFLFAGRWCTTTGGSISGNSYHSQNENMSGLKSACSNHIRNANAVYLSVSVFPCAIAHCVRIPMLNMFISDGLSPPLGLCLLAQSLWRESNLLDNWQLTMLPLSELCEFNPRWIRDHFSASLWVIGRFPQPEKKQHEYLCMYACVRVCVHGYTHTCMSVSMFVSHASTVIVSNIYDEANLTQICGGDLKFDQVSFLGYFIYRAGDAPMILLFHCEKAIHDTTDCVLVF